MNLALIEYVYNFYKRRQNQNQNDRYVSLSVSRMVRQQPCKYNFVWKYSSNAHRYQYYLMVVGTDFYCLVDHLTVFGFLRRRSKHVIVFHDQTVFNSGYETGEDFFDTLSRGWVHWTVSITPDTVI